MTLEETLYEKLCEWSFQEHLTALEREDVAPNRKDLTQHEILRRWKPPIDLIAACAIALGKSFRDRQRLFHEGKYTSVSEMP